MLKRVSALLLAYLAAAIPSFANFVMFGASSGSQSIAGIALSNSTFIGGSTSGTVVGALSVTMNSGPAFSGPLSLVSSGGVSCSGGDTTDFQIVSGNLETNGTVAAGS